MQSIIKYEFNEHLIISKKTMESVCKSIEIAAELCIDCVKKGN
jgi:phosphoheptose isomerase